MVCHLPSDMSLPSEQGVSDPGPSCPSQCSTVPICLGRPKPCAYPEDYQYDKKSRLLRKFT
jgi:hypothetical protein